MEHLISLSNYITEVTKEPNLVLGSLGHTMSRNSDRFYCIKYYNELLKEKVTVSDFIPIKNGVMLKPGDEDYENELSKVVFETTIIEENKEAGFVTIKANDINLVLNIKENYIHQNIDCTFEKFIGYPLKKGTKFQELRYISII